MAKTTRLVMRGSIFYFRMALPCDLVAMLGQREVKRSLRTSDRALATVRCRALSNNVDLLCRDMRNMLQSQNNTVDETVKTYFQYELDRGVDFAEVFAPEPEVDLDDIIETLKEGIKDRQRLIGRQKCSNDLQGFATEIVDTIPPDILQSRFEALSRAKQGVMRAKVEAERILVAMLEGKYADTGVRDPLFDGVEPSPEVAARDYPNIVFSPQPVALPAPTAAPSPIIETLLEEFYKSLRAKGAKPKTMGDYRLTMELARAVIAFEKSVTEFVTADVKALRDLIGVLPAHHGKNPATKGLSPLDAVKAGVDLPKMSYKTQKKRLDFFKKFLRCLVAEEHLEHVPGEKIVVNAVKSKEVARLPYKMSALRTIFQSPIWSGRRSVRVYASSGTLKLKDSRFWIPLIALFSGMRAGEILQLQKSDLRCDDGVWYFDIAKNAGEDDKSLKTGSSWRRVPIHRVLLDLGFVAFAQTANDGRIFADQPLGSDGTYSQRWSKFWKSYSVRIGFYQPKYVFHSFRHNFVDALHDAGVPDSIANQLCGHSDKSAHAGYGKGASLKRLKEEIDKIEYPGLDLTHLLASDWKNAGLG